MLMYNLIASLMVIISTLSADKSLAQAVRAVRPELRRIVLSETPDGIEIFTLDYNTKYGAAAPRFLRLRRSGDAWSMLFAYPHGIPPVAKSYDVRFDLDHGREKLFTTYVFDLSAGLSVANINRYLISAFLPEMEPHCHPAHSPFLPDFRQVEPFK